MDAAFAAASLTAPALSAPNAVPVMQAGSRMKMNLAKSWMKNWIWTKRTDYEISPYSVTVT